MNNENISKANCFIHIGECPAYLLAKKLRKKVHVVNNITCYRLEDQNIGEILAKKLQNFTLLRGGKLSYLNLIKYFWINYFSSKYRSNRVWSKVQLC